MNFISSRAVALPFVCVLVALCPSSAGAASAVVNVRIEGPTETLFEGPIRTEGHTIQASSDTQARQCNGTNHGAHTTPGPTPTAAAVDAMTLAGETFDGKWYSSEADYLITRWGPDKQNLGNSEYWGLFVNQSLTSIGGCEYELAEGDQVLWLFNAFSHQPLLTLYPAGQSTTAAIPTATVALSTPLAVQVDAYSTSEGAGHSPTPFAVAEVSPVATGANGFQRVETGSSQSVSAAANGSATVTFTTPGWHRLKATAAGAFRSNRLDVCVPAQGAAGCGALPADDQVRSVNPLPNETQPESELEHKAKTETKTSSGGQTTGTGTGSGNGNGNGSSSGGGGSSRTGTGSGGATAGRPRPSTRLHVDGLVLDPLDDRAPELHYRGSWRRIADAAAWMSTLTVGHARDSVMVSLAHGRAAFVLRDVSAGARVEILAAGRRQIFTLTADRGNAPRLLVGWRRKHNGNVELRILHGAVALDGVALLR